jgi:trk system potassium uptake protein TrkA
MKIIILGAGQVGGTLAENLLLENNDITLVDLNSERLRYLENRMDIRTIVGPAAHPDILRQAGAEDADMVIAVTSSDETNMIACQVAYTIFNTPTKIARIRSPRYLAYQELFDKKAIPIDFCISPEHQITENVKLLIEHPGALQVLDFANGNIKLVVMRISDGPLVGKTYRELADYLPGIKICIAAIFRKDQSLVLEDKLVFSKQDEVIFIAATPAVLDIMAGFRQFKTLNRRVMIGGGGHIGKRLAEALEQDYRVKIIEHNPQRAQHLAENLQHSLVLKGDIADRELLLSEDIDHTDVFCAVSNDDEANIISALQAKRLGVGQVMSLTTRTAYVDLIEGSEIDVVISPQLVTTGTILTHLRRGDFIAVHALRRGQAEAVEAIAHGTKETSKVIGRKLSDIKLPKGASICALARNNKVIIGLSDITVEPDDHLILLLLARNRISEVEKLFQVDVTFV